MSYDYVNNHAHLPSAQPQKMTGSTETSLQHANLTAHNYDTLTVIPKWSVIIILVHFALYYLPSVVLISSSLRLAPGFCDTVIALHSCFHT